MASKKRSFSTISRSSDDDEDERPSKSGFFSSFLCFPALICLLFYVIQSSGRKDETDVSAELKAAKKAARAFLKSLLVFYFSFEPLPLNHSSSFLYRFQYVDTPFTRLLRLGLRRRGNILFLKDKSEKRDLCVLLFFFFAIFAHSQFAGPTRQPSPFLLASFLNSLHWSRGAKFKPTLLPSSNLAFFCSHSNHSFVFTEVLRWRFVSRSS
jgi:hypothetical protein